MFFDQSKLEKSVFVFYGQEIEFWILVQRKLLTTRFWIEPRNLFENFVVHRINLDLWTQNAKIDFSNFRE
jgi:hypothetical protein